MMSEWKEYKLGDVLNVKHGFAFKGEFFSTVPTNDILLSPGNFNIGGGFKSDKFKYYNGNYPESYVLKENDVIVTMTDLSKEGDTLGYSAKIPSHQGIRYLHNQRLGLVELKDNSVNLNFIYWLLRTKKYQQFIVSSATGTTVKHTSPTRIGEYSFCAPDLPTQIAIAEILSSLDDKIELNNNINKELEKLAQTLFKQWFIDFDFPDQNGEPYQSSGGEMVESELGMIPKNWEVKKLSALIRLTGGGTPKRSSAEYWDGNIKWFSIQDIPNDSQVFVVDTKEKITELGLNKSSTKLLPRGTTIITARGTVGKLALVAEPMAMNQSCYGVNGASGLGEFYTYFNLKNVVEKLRQNVHGAVFDTITSNTFDTIKSIYGNNNLANLFEEIVRPVMEQIENNCRENQELSSLRDTLLPKLISGELNVKDL